MLAALAQPLTTGRLGHAQEPTTAAPGANGRALMDLNTKPTSDQNSYGADDPSLRPPNITRLWDKYLPRWREIKAQPKAPHDPEADKKLVEELNRVSDSPDLEPHDEHDVDKLNYVTVIKNVRMRKGRWQRFSEEQEERMRAQGLIR